MWGNDIYCRLQGVSEPNTAELVFKTPMRLASQFAASFGRSELDNLNSAKRLVNKNASL